MSSFPRTQLQGRTPRLISSRYPTIGVFDDLVDDESELRIAFELEAATNPRLNDAVARLHRLPEGALVAAPEGNGATMVMAAFIHTSESGGRFHDEALGAWYAATDVETAIAETAYHNERRLRLSEGGFPNRVQLRELIATVDIECLDLRGQQAEQADLYDPDDYSASQAFAQSIRWPYVDNGEDALAYDSVRRHEGGNIVIFRPQAVPLPILQGDHYQYDWDRAGTITVSKLTNVASG